MPVLKAFVSQSKQCFSMFGSTLVFSARTLRLTHRLPCEETEPGERAQQSNVVNGRHATSPSPLVQLLALLCFAPISPVLYSPSTVVHTQMHKIMFWVGGKQRLYCASVCSRRVIKSSDCACLHTHVME